MNANIMAPGRPTDDFREFMDNSRWHFVALSARTPEALLQRVGDLQAWLGRQDEQPDLDRLACSLLLGRAHLVHRLGWVVADLAGLRAVMDASQRGVEHVHRFTGARRLRDPLPGPLPVAAWRDAAQGRFEAVRDMARHYAQGAEADWQDLYPAPRPRRLRLPTYPFARERHWMFDPETEVPASAPAEPPAAPSAASAVSLFVPGWMPWAAQSSAPQATYGSALLLVDSPAMADAVTEALTRCGAFAGLPGEPRIVAAWPGAHLREVAPGHMTINPADEGAFAGLLDAWAPRPSEARLVVHAWSWHAEGAAHRSLALRASFGLVKALAKEAARASTCVVQLAPRDSDSLLPQALAGLGRSLSFILPRLHWTAVHGATLALSPGEVVDGLAREAVRPVTDRAHEVELTRDGSRHRHFTPLPRVSPPTPAARGGVYLVTGGTGGLGRAVAAHLAAGQRAKVALLSRRGPRALDRQWVAEACAHGGEIEAFEADVCERQSLEGALAEIRRRWGPLHGVIHAAGVASTALAADKGPDDVDEVLRPKVDGTELLDELTRPDPLRFFVLFSSTAAVLGDFGMGDYAMANRYLDAFAFRREERRRQGERCGVTRSINWPLWREGGMQMAAQDAALYLSSAGLSVLETQDGLALLDTVIEGKETQVVVGAGTPEAIESALNGRSHAAAREAAAIEPREVAVPARSDVDADLPYQVLQDLLASVSRLLKLDPQKIDPDDNLGNLGFDSITLKTLLEQLSERLGEDVPPAILFGHGSLSALSLHLAQRYGDKLAAHYTKPVLPGEAAADEAGAEAPMPGGGIAIIGAAGIFPAAPDLETFWKNLDASVDMTMEIPAARWDWRDHYGDPAVEANKCFVKHGAFIEDPAQFDAAFFRISPHEAELMDPQQRLLLQTAWRAIEDAAHAPSSLSGQPVAVFVGVQFSDYQHLLAQLGELHPHMATGNANSIVANRLSYQFNFTGPSESIDTACSSSLVAVHRAVRALRSGECSMAVAAGVNLVLSPQNVVATGMLGVLSPDGRCKTFDRRADGYVKGEGVAALVLKRLDEAVRDGDPIRAVIRGSAVNHGGRAASLTAPNPVAQTAVIQQALSDAGLSARNISYVEAHGTGTELGDPIEVEALKDAFTPAQVDDAAWCGLGTVKSHIGHLEPAAGVAGMCKVMLSLEHRRLPGLRHFEELNPYIRLDGSPFQLVTQAQPWQVPVDAQGQAQPRYAGISSFGFGGCNAHVVLGEWDAPAGTGDLAPAEGIFPLSAKDPVVLRDYARAVAAALHLGHAGYNLRDACHTFQVGRDAMPLRAAVVARDLPELQHVLEQLAAGRTHPRLFCGPWEAAPSGGAPVASACASPLAATARAWVNGERVDWAALRAGTGASVAVRRIRLPAYPFAKARHWIPRRNAAAAPPADVADVPGSGLLLAIPTWRPQPLPGATARAVGGDALILLGGSGDAAWQARFDELDARWQGLGGSPAIRGVSGAWEQVVEAAAARNAGRIVVLHAGDGGWPPASSSGGAVWPLFELLRTLERRTTSRIAVFSCEQSPAIPTPAFAALAGLLRSWAHESRRIEGRLLSFDSADAACVADWLIGELRAPVGRIDHVRYGNGGRAVRGWTERVPAVKAAESEVADGVFLVTGGAGGVGRLLCEQLIAQGARAVCVAGRSERSLDGPPALHYRRVDVGDAGEVQAWVDDVRTTHGRIDGVFHLAGVLRDGLHEGKTAEDFEEVLRPKAGGVVHLDAATREDYLRFFVAFSSLSGIVGNSGQTDYAFANAFVDAFSAWREQQRQQGTRRGRSVSIAWPLWRDAGMQVDGATEELIHQMTGMLAMPGSTGVALAIQLATEPGAQEQVVVFHGDVVRGRELLGLHERATAAPAQPTLDRNISAEEVGGLLARELSAITGLGIDALNPDISVEEFGLDSLLAVRLLRRIHDVTGLRLYPSELIEQNTLRKLAAYLHSELSSSAVPVAEAPRPARRSPILLLSTPRAGSTLLRVMLMGHAQLYAPPELHLLGHASMQARRDAMVASRQGFLGEGLIKTVAALQGCPADDARALVASWEEQDRPIEWVYDWLVKRVGDQRLVDKSPSYAADRKALAQAESDFDEPFYVHLVRHPMAVAESFARNRFGKMLGRQDDPFVLAEQIWTHSNRNVGEFLRGIPQERYAVIRYEDLVRAPEQCLRSLCDRLGVPFDEGMLHPYEGDKLTTGLHDESMAVGDPNFLMHSGIDATLADAWKTQAPAAHQLSSATLALAEQLGYAAEAGGGLPLSPAQAQFMEIHAADPRWYILIHAEQMSTRPLVRAEVDAALQQLVRRHPALRLRFQPTRDGWKQSVVDSCRCEVDWIERAEGDSPPYARAEIKMRLLSPPMDVGCAPLLRCVVAASPVHWQIGLMVHHLVADGVSAQVLLNDLHALLSGGPLPASPGSGSWAGYLELTKQLAGDDAALEPDYWRQHMPAKPLALPLDFADGRNLVSGECTLRRVLSTRAWLAALDERESLFWFLNLALVRAVAHSSGTPDPVIAHRLHRRRPTPDSRFENVVGWFAGDVPLRLASRGGDVVPDDIAACKRVFQRLPAGGTAYELLSLQGRLPPAHEVAPVRFNYQPLAGHLSAGTWVDHDLWEPPEHVRLYLLDWVVKDFGDRLEVRVRYADDCWREESIARLVDAWEREVTALIGHWASAAASCA